MERAHCDYAANEDKIQQTWLTLHQIRKQNVNYLCKMQKTQMQRPPTASPFGDYVEMNMNVNMHYACTLFRENRFDQNEKSKKETTRNQRNDKRTHLLLAFAYISVFSGRSMSLDFRVNTIWDDIFPQFNTTHMSRTMEAIINGETLHISERNTSPDIGRNHFVIDNFTLNTPLRLRALQCLVPSTATSYILHCGTGSAQ